MSQEDSISFSRVTIVGPGLLGGSIGMALREKGITGEIWAYLRDEKKRQTCTNLSWCDRAVLNLQEAVQESELVVLCTPVETILDHLPMLSGWVKTGCLITDIGSLKKEICECAHRWFKDRPSSFVGSHPMTGSEKNGIEFASSDILKDKNCIVTPMYETDTDSCQIISRMWQALGMKVTKINPELHDEIVAWVSHLPHIIASGLINAINNKNEKWINFCGNGLKDTTRVASGNPEMWKQIIMGNKDNVTAGINHMVEELNLIKKALEFNDREQLMEILDSAKVVRDKLDDTG